MLLRRFLFASVGSLASAALLFAQTPTAPVISARGVTNFFTREPAPGVVGLGGLVQISGLNFDPPDGLTATDVPGPTRLGDTQVIIGGKAAGAVLVVPNPDNVTSVGPPAAAANGGANAVTAARVVIATSQANTVSAVAYNNNRQVGILVIRIP